MLNEINYLNSENNALIAGYSSQLKGCNADNVLNSDNKLIWLSEEGLPQYLIIDMSKMTSRPTIFKYFAIYCWHAYPTNPKLFELLISKDNLTFHSLGNFDLILKPGTQYFIIEDENITAFNFLKIVIKETFGGNRAYLNNIFLFEDLIKYDYEIVVSDSRERNMPRKSVTISTDKKFEIDLKESLETQRKNSLKSELNTFNQNTSRSMNISYNKNDKNKIIDNNINKNLIKNDLIDNMYLITDSDLTSRKDEENSNHSKSDEIVNATYSMQQSKRKSILGSGNNYSYKNKSDSINDQRYFTKFKEVSKSSVKYNNKYANEIKDESKGDLERNDLDDIDIDHNNESKLEKSLDSKSFNNNVNNFLYDKSNKSESNLNLNDLSMSKVKYDSRLNNDMNNISLSMSNSRYQADLNKSHQESSKKSENFSRKSNKYKNSDSNGNYYNNQEKEGAFPKNSENFENLTNRQIYESQEILDINENNYKSLDNQIKEMQNQINKLTLESDNREIKNDDLYSGNTKKRVTNKKSLAYESSQNLENFKTLQTDKFDIDPNNIIDFVNIKNSSYKTPEEILSTLKSNYANPKAFISINRYVKSSNENENQNAHANELEKYLNNDESQLDINSNNLNENQSNNDLNTITQKQNFYLNQESKINQIENRISNMNNEMNSMKNELNKINNNIEILLETKTLLNKNNMNFILEKCKNLIDSNFKNYVNNHQDNKNLHLLHNQNENYNKNVEKSCEKYVDRLIEENFQNLTNRIQNKIYKAILKPTVKKLENNLKTNLNEVKLHFKYLERNKLNLSHKKSSQDKIKKYHKTIYKVIEDLIQKLSKKEMILSQIERDNSLKILENENH